MEYVSRSFTKAFEKYAEKGITPKAVIAVNLYGQSAKMDEIKKFAMSTKLL